MKRERGDSGKGAQVAKSECVCVCFPSLEDWSFSQCVCVHVSLCVLCSPVGLKLINLACFCLCIIPSSVNATINPRVRSRAAVPLRVKVNMSATCLRQRRGTHHKILRYKETETKKKGGKDGALCRRIRPQNSVLSLPMKTTLDDSSLKAALRSFWGRRFNQKRDFFMHSQPI